MWQCFSLVSLSVVRASSSARSKGTVLDLRSASSQLTVMENETSSLCLSENEKVASRSVKEVGTGSKCRKVLRRLLSLPSYGRITVSSQRAPPAGNRAFPVWFPELRKCHESRLRI